MAAASTPPDRTPTRRSAEGPTEIAWANSGGSVDASLVHARASSIHEMSDDSTAETSVWVDGSDRQPLVVTESVTGLVLSRTGGGG